MNTSRPTDDFPAAWLASAIRDVDARLRPTLADDQHGPSVAGDDPLPVHTVYLPANDFRSSTARAWGEHAHRGVIETGGYLALAERLEVSDVIAEEVAAQTESRILTRPIEDLRIDFEDGYRATDDSTEDQDAIRAAHEAATELARSEGPASVGLRPKSLEVDTRERSLRTVTRFFCALAEANGGIDHAIVTLPKVTALDQVEAFVDFLAGLEQQLDLAEETIDLEIQVEMPDLVSHFLSQGDFPLNPAVTSGRVSGLHFGTYDYTAALGIHPEQQRLDHPAAVYAKLAMQLAAAGTGVRISDGSTNRVPNLKDNFMSWTHHAELVRHSLALGIPQGWDMHPLHLPTRFMCVNAYYLAGRDAAIQRLTDYMQNASGDVLDEPASVRSIARFLVDGVRHGAFDLLDIERTAETPWTQLVAIASSASNQSRENS